MYLGFSFSKLKRMNVFLQLHYRYGTIYHPYLIKFDLDLCELFQKDSSLKTDKIFKIFYLLLESEIPSLLKGCPYEVSIRIQFVKHLSRSNAISESTRIKYGEPK